MADIEVLEGDGAVTVIATVNGQNVFDFDFLAYTGASVRVVFRAGMVGETPLTFGVDYSVAGLGQAAGGSITLIGDFAGVAVIDDPVLIYRSTPISRLFDYQTAGDFRADTVNRELDTLVMIDQEARRDIDRSFKAPIGEGGGAVIAGADGTVAVFAGGDLVEGPSVAEIEGAEGAAQRAEDALAAVLVAGGNGFDTRAQAIAYRPQVVPSKLVLNGYYMAGDTNAPLLFAPGSAGAPGGINITLDDEVTVEPFELKSDMPTPAMFGFVADGVTANDAALATADTFALLRAQELVFPAGAYRIDNSMTIASPVRLMHGAYFVVDAGATLTFSNLLTLPRAYVFRGAGATAFGAKAMLVAFPEWWGANPDGLDASAALNLAAIQKAMDVSRNVLLDEGEYRVSGSLGYTVNGTYVEGHGRANTTVRTTSTSAPVFHNPDKATTTRLFCGLRRIKVMAPLFNTTARVVDWQSMQFWEIDEFWIVGASVAGVTALWLGAVWVTTECTYGSLTKGYIGLCSTGIRFDDGANNIHVDQVRVQCSVASGFGVLLLGTGAGRVSSNQIEACGFEFPGQINTGVFASTGVDGLVLFGNRFESLAAGINVAAAAEHVEVNGQSHHYSSNTTKIIVPASGTNGVVPFPAVRAYIDGTSLAIQRAFGLTAAVTRKAGVPAGGYRFPFSLPDNGYFAQVSSNQHRTIVTAQSATFIEVETYNSAGALADAAIVQLTIDTQRF